MHGRGPERELANLTRVLTLTPDQQTGVKAILDQEGEQMKALRSKAQADPSTGQTPETREARMAQFKQIHDESNTKITALLNDDQKKIFAGWTAKRTAKMQHHRGQGRARRSSGRNSTAAVITQLQAEKGHLARANQVLGRQPLYSFTPAYYFGSVLQLPSYPSVNRH